MTINNHYTLLKLLKSALVLLTSCWLALLGAQALGDNLTASVDRDTLGLQETFTLTLRYDELVNAAPDYSLLQKDFDILNTQSGTQTSFVNGVTEAITQWKIALAPKKIGKALIPSFNINGAVSDAIEMTITGKSQSPQNASDDVSVEIETSKDSLYTQEQLLLTVRLFTKVNLTGAELQPLDIPNALVISLGEKQYQTRINNNAAIVVETRYAVFPQKSGELIIPSLLYQVTKGSSQQDIWSRAYGNNTSNLLRLRTDEKHIEVLAGLNTNDTTQNSAWLPAKKLTLSEHWSTSPEQAKIGEPLTRTITITADGLTAGQLLPLPITEVNGLNLYPDKAQTDDQKNDKGVVGSRIETTAIVANRAGKFLLPEVKVKWWNTETKTFEEASIPATTIKVSGVASKTAQDQLQQELNQQSIDQQNTDQQNQAGATPSDAETPDASSAAGINESNSAKAQSTSAPWWIYITQAISALALIILGAAYLNTRAQLKRIIHKNNELNSELSLEEKAAWNQLKQAMNSDQPQEVRRSLIHWGNAHWQPKKIQSLQDIMEACGSEELSNLLQKLDRNLYSGSKDSIDNAQLLKHLGQIRHAKKKNIATGKLSSLYPQ